MSPRENSRSCSMVDAYVVRKRGYFGQFGGQYVPETLMPALHELEAAYDEAKEDPAFQEELESYYRHYGGGRETRLSPPRHTDHHVVPAAPTAPCVTQRCSPRKILC